MPWARAGGRTADRDHRAEDHQDHPGHQDHQVRRGPRGPRGHQVPAGRPDLEGHQALLDRRGHQVREEHRGLAGPRRDLPDRRACPASAVVPADGPEVETPEGQADVEEW